MGHGFGTATPAHASIRSPYLMLSRSTKVSSTTGIGKRPFRHSQIPWNIFSLLPTDLIFAEISNSIHASYPQDGKMTDVNGGLRTMSEVLTPQDSMVPALAFFPIQRFPLFLALSHSKDVDFTHRSGRKTCAKMLSLANASVLWEPAPLVFKP